MVSSSPARNNYLVMMMAMVVTVVTVVTVVMVTSENWPSSCYKQAAFTVDAPGFGRMLGSSVGVSGIGHFGMMFTVIGDIIALNQRET